MHNPPPPHKKNKTKKPTPSPKKKLTKSTTDICYLLEFLFMLIYAFLKCKFFCGSIDMKLIFLRSIHVVNLHQMLNC